MKSLPNRREAPSAADSAKDKWDWPTRDQLNNFWTDQLTDKDNLLWELDSIRDGVLRAPMPLHYAQPWVDPRDIGEIARLQRVVGGDHDGARAPTACQLVPLTVCHSPASGASSQVATPGSTSNCPTVPAVLTTDTIDHRRPPWVLTDSTLLVAIQSSPPEPAAKP